MYREYLAKTTELLREATGLSDVLITDGGDHADVASTAAFALAKQEKKNPALIAKDIVEKIAANPKSAGIEVTCKGPYINFVFGSEYVAESVAAARKETYGQLPEKTEKVIIEHTSANPTGP